MGKERNDNQPATSIHHEEEKKVLVVTIIVIKAEEDRDIDNIVTNMPEHQSLTLKAV